MNYFTSVILTTLIIISTPLPSFSQQASDRFSDQFNRHFNYASMRIQSIAEEMPQEYYTWRPGEGVMSFAEVCMHIARYNYYYLVVTLDYPGPDNIDLDNMESITDKDTIVSELERSIEYVKNMMVETPDDKLNEPAALYGMDVTVQAVLMQLITHKNQHLGQAIAYARMNDIVPPWNQ